MKLTHRSPFRSAPILPVGDRGFVVTVIDEAGQSFEERSAVTWEGAIKLAKGFSEKFPTGLIIFSDHTHIWRLSEL